MFDDDDDDDEFSRNSGNDRLGTGNSRLDSVYVSTILNHF